MPASLELANATDPARMRFHTIQKEGLSVVGFWYSHRTACLSLRTSMRYTARKAA